AGVARRGANDLTERRAGDRAQLAGTAAALARLDRRARLGAVAVAVLARGDDLVGDLHGAAAGGLEQVDRGRGRDIAALRRVAAATPAAAAEDAAEAAGPEQRLEDVRNRAEAVEVRRH